MTRSLAIFTALSLGGTLLFGACSSSDTPRDVTAAKPEAGIIDLDSGEIDPNDIEKFIVACGKAETGASKSPAYLEIVLDGSGSMGLDGKWEAAVEALDAVFEEMSQQADPNLAVGLMIFEDQKSQGATKYPTKVDIPPAFVDSTQYQALRNRVDSTDNYGGTPTYAALKGAYGLMSAYTPVAPTPEGGNRVVILMSDGEPTDDKAGCIKLAKQFASADPAIKTFSVGIGPFPSTSGYDPKFMGDLAVAGETPNSATCNPASKNLADVCHFQVTPGGNVQKMKSDFIDALNKIRGLAVGCEYAIDKTGDFDPAATNVIWTDGNGKKKLIPKDPDNGWSFDNEDDPTKIILNGQACGDASSDIEGAIKILIGCKSK